eukprot:TRINITY_DN93602_c0_g1_i1.p2 TRINITY_DN93602_c0_g1~~TRINITY_DN93602_c0_g1_i1.p2  ORF type:complete len:206 (+),score=48.77 TRINITY_DN93602_c0_g1_i1:81-698(+)
MAQAPVRLFQEVWPVFEDQEYQNNPDELDEPSAVKAAAQAPMCEGCNKAMQFTNYSKGNYSEGWACSNYETCGTVVSRIGEYRWSCLECERDYCIKCKGNVPSLGSIILRPGMQARDAAVTCSCMNIGAWSRETNEKAPMCLGCGGPMVNTDYSEGDYAQGWACSNYKLCGTVVEKPGVMRLHCKECQRDYCMQCKENYLPLYTI